MNIIPVRRKNSIKKPKTVLLISTRQIGDVLLTTPLLHTLRTNYPEAKIDVLVFKGKEGVLEGNPDINIILTVSDKPTKQEYRETIKQIFRKYDVAFITQASDRGHMYGLIAAKQRVGLIPEMKSHQWWKKLSCKAWQVLDDNNTHTVTQSLLLAECIGLNLTYDVTLPQRTESKDYFQYQFGIDTENLNYVVIHPYPMWQYKLWTITGWRTLIHHLHSLNLHVIVSGGGAPSELAYCNEIASPFTTLLTNLAGKTRFSDAAFLLKSAKAYIGMDTAMTHLAAASGTQTLALFGPTNPIKWAPWPFGYHDGKSPWKHYSSETQEINNVMLLQGHGDCVPCHKAGCDDHNNSHSKCLDSLDANRVIQAFRRLIKIDVEIATVQ
jgi:heptosyltransferase III